MSRSLAVSLRWVRARRRLRMVLVVAMTMLVGMVVPATAIAAPASATAAATASSSITCGPVYGLQDVGNHQIYSINQGSGQLTAAGAFGPTSPDPRMNGLALSSSGVAYGFERTSYPSPLPILSYNPATGASTPIGSITTVGNRNSIMGGFDPTTGRYWVGLYNPDLGRIEFYAFDTTTNTSLGLQFTMPDISGDPGVVLPNGDLTFDSQGRMYVVLSYGDGFTTSNRIVVFNTPPTDGGSHSGTLLSYIQPNSSSFNGIAFGSDGFLYANALNSAGTADTVYQINPTTGVVVSSHQLTNPDGSTTSDIVDLASCASPFTLTLQKNIAGRAVNTDQFNLAITGNGVTTNNTGVTSGSTTGLQTDDPAVAGPILVRPGQSYTIGETGSNGANLANYSSTYQCVDKAHNNAVVTSGSAAPGSVTIPNTIDGTGADVVCTITNTPKTASLKLVKSAALTKDVNNDGKAGVGDQITFSLPGDQHRRRHGAQRHRGRPAGRPGRSGGDGDLPDR